MTDTSSRLSRTVLLLSVAMFLLALVLPAFDIVGPTAGWAAVLISASSLLDPAALFRANPFFTVPQKLFLSIGWLLVCAHVAAFVLFSIRTRRSLPIGLQIAVGATAIYAAPIPAVFPHASLLIGYFMWLASLLLLAVLLLSVVRPRSGHGVAV